ncbi:hypothetical protein KY360_02665 [Candidatus Woesearchaeota archaeon]|nr:hypothetical protein [Candidatus Woesearchaeota archaeon]
MKKSTIILVVVLLLLAVYLAEIKDFTGGFFWLSSESCSDSDGQNYFTKGSVSYTYKTWFRLNKSITRIYTDRCRNNNTLYEYYCSNNRIRIEPYECENGCRDGACIKSCQDKCSGLSVCEGGKCIKGSLRRPIKIAVIEFKAKDDFEYGRAYYCCRTHYLSGERECFWTNGQLNCDIEDKSFSFLEVLNNPNGYFGLEVTADESVPTRSPGPHSLFYINDFFKKEAARYGYSYDNDIFNVSIFGPYKLEEDPPQRGRRTGSNQDIVDFFDKEIKKQKINISHYDSITIIFLNDFHQNGGYQGFLSFAPFPNIYISLETSSAYRDEKLETFIHENAHNLGYFSGLSFVKDKYTAPCPRGPYMSCCNIPEGIPEPNKEPLYPQNKACLMCGGIVLSEDGGGQGANLNQIVICQQTAKELGWIN